MNYFYEAKDGSGQTVLGKIDADSLNEAHRLLVERGYRPQSVAPNPAPQGAGIADSITLMGGLNTPVAAGGGTELTTTDGGQVRFNRPSYSGELALGGNGAGTTIGSPLDIPVAVPRSAPRPAPSSTRGGVSTQELMLFFQQLAPLVKSGMTIFAALDNLAKRTKNRALADTAHEMAENARKGGRITDVMAQYPRIFPEHVVGTVRAGELGGFLEIVLGEVALNYEQNIALYRGSWKWKALVVQAWFGLALVIPFFCSLFDSLDFGANMVLYARREVVVLSIFGGLYFLALLAAKRAREPDMKRRRDEIALKLPAFGDLQRQAALSAFVRMLRKLYNSGVGPIHAWEAAMNTADNTVIRDRLTSAYSVVQHGGSLGDAFAATGLFADNIEQVIVTGQLSGEVVESLDQAATFYQTRVQDAHDKARLMFWRIAVLGALIFGGGAFLWMAKSYFAGIFDLVDHNFGS